MRVALLSFCLSAALLMPALPAGAEVDASVVRTLSFGEEPIDMAISADNNRLFVLLEGGRVLVYSPGGVLQETLQLEKPAAGIEVSKSGDILYLHGGEGKGVEILRLEFIQEITVDSSPVKGEKTAAVTVAVFNDFQ